MDDNITIGIRIDISADNGIYTAICYTDGYDIVYGRPSDYNKEGYSSIASVFHPNMYSNYDNLYTIIKQHFTCPIQLHILSFYLTIDNDDEYITINYELNKLNISLLKSGVYSQPSIDELPQKYQNNLYIKCLLSGG